MNSHLEHRVALLGGTGFAGRNVREVLEDAGIAVKVFTRTTGCDLLDMPKLWAKLDEYKPTHVVNCAALVGSVNYVSDFAADVVDVNMRMILNVYRVAQQMRHVVIVNPIANCAYPGVLDTYEERSLWDGPIHPSVLAYGSTRRMMWVLAKCYHDQYGVRSANLMVPNMYGPYDSTNPNKAHALNALAMKFVRAVSENLPEIEVWGTGKPIREWLFVRDFAAVVKQVVLYNHIGLDPLNIAQNRGHSVTELVEMLAKVTGFQGKLVYNHRYPDGSPKKVMDDRLFKLRFPNVAFTPIDTGLQQTISYYRDIF